jgi:hypothetical protein
MLPILVSFLRSCDKCGGDLAATDAGQFLCAPCRAPLAAREARRLTSAIAHHYAAARSLLHEAWFARRDGDAARLATAIRMVRWHRLAIAKNRAHLRALKGGSQ